MPKGCQHAAMFSLFNNSVQSAVSVAVNPLLLEVYRLAASCPYGTVLFMIYTLIEMLTCINNVQ